MLQGAVACRHVGMYIVVVSNLKAHFRAAAAAAWDKREIMSHWPRS